MATDGYPIFNSPNETEDNTTWINSSTYNGVEYLVDGSMKTLYVNIDDGFLDTTNCTSAC